MPSDEELANAITEMRKQGLSEDEIRETLSDMGVSDDVIAKLLGGQPTPATPPSQPSANELIPERQPPTPVSAQPEKAASPSSDDDLFSNLSTSSTDVVSNLISGGSESSGQSTPSEEQTVSEPAPNVAPIPSESKPLSPPPVSVPAPVSSAERSTSAVSSSPPTTAPATFASDDAAEIKEMLRELKKELKDQRALLSALQKILQEILDTDRTIVVGLYEKVKK